MKHIDLCFSGGVIGVLIILSLVSIPTAPAVQECDPCLCNEKMLYHQIAELYAQEHPYVNYTHTCFEMSGELVKILTGLEYQAETVSGYLHLNCSGGPNYFNRTWFLHRWVKVFVDDGWKYIEATSGNVYLPGHPCYLEDREGYYLDTDTGEWKKEMWTE